MLFVTYFGVTASGINLYTCIPSDLKAYPDRNVRVALCIMIFHTALSVLLYPLCTTYDINLVDT